MEAISQGRAKRLRVKESSLGLEGSRHGMEEYVEIKYAMMAGSRGLARSIPASTQFAGAISELVPHPFRQMRLVGKAGFGGNIA